MLTALLPPGKLWRLVGESLIVPLLQGCADELARLDARAMDLLDELIPTLAVETLPDWERSYELTSDGTTAERQARVTARYIALERRRPVDFQTILAPLLGQDPADVVVIERTHAMAAAMGDDREIRRFFIYRDPTLAGAYYLDSAQTLVDDINRSTCVGHVIESVDFLCDDPYSLCDRDLLGA
jgi:hypothetical protein